MLHETGCVASYGNWAEQMDTSPGLPKRAQRHRLPGLQQEAKSHEFMALLLWENKTNGPSLAVNEQGNAEIERTLRQLSRQATLGNDFHVARFAKYVGAHLQEQPPIKPHGPISLASLIEMNTLRKPSSVECHDVLQYDARRDPQSTGYPTPSGGEPLMRDIYRNYRKGPNYESIPSSATRNPIDLLRLTFNPGQVDQFRHDQSANFEPVRSPSAVAWNEWRRAVVREAGCEKLAWGICHNHPNTIILFICRLIPERK